MDKSQEELYRACLMHPAMDGRQASITEQAFTDRMEAKHPEKCRRIAQKMIDAMQVARQRALRMRTRLANENKRLAATELAADYAARRSSAREEATRHNSEVGTSVLRDFAEELAASRREASQPQAETAEATCEPKVDSAEKPQAAELDRYDLVLDAPAIMQVRPRGQWVRTADLARLIDEAFKVASDAVDAKFG